MPFGERPAIRDVMQTDWDGKSGGIGDGGEQVGLLGLTGARLGYQYLSFFVNVADSKAGT